MKRWLLLLWLLVPLPLVVWHFGPGQTWLARDRAHTLIRQARPDAVVFTGDALVNGHFDAFFIGTGVGVSSGTQATDDNHKFGIDLPVQAGFQIFDKWTSKGQLFFEFRAPIARSFDHNWKAGLGVRFLF